jgi:hypothetical protein
MQLEERGERLLVAALCALNQTAFNQTAFGIVSVGCIPHWDQMGCCRGNYASRHGSLLR